MARYLVARNRQASALRKQIFRALAVRLRVQRFTSSMLTLIFRSGSRSACHEALLRLIWLSDGTSGVAKKLFTSRKVAQNRLITAKNDTTFHQISTFQVFPSNHMAPIGIRKRRIICVLHQGSQAATGCNPMFCVRVWLPLADT
jgi:hypothetical protein